jgi:hypothetical protein
MKHRVPAFRAAYQIKKHQGKFVMRRSIFRVVSSCFLTSLFAIDIAHAGMSTAGQLGVSPSGAATYTIPIQIPPGTAGIEPKLAFAYNSQGGNGLLGMGWSLSGLSAIGRCPQTKAQDGVMGGVNFDMNDRYCLDGQRLMVISGTYGADGAEYRTEQEGFAKIISYGAAGNGPAWFKVWTKSGQVMEFGNTEDSRIQAQGKATVIVWALNRLKDTKHNYLDIAYTEDNPNGDYYVNRIDYAGNVNASTVTTNSIQFFYEARPDIIKKYRASSLIKQAVRLRNLKTFTGSTLIKNYHLSYDASGQVGSKLSSVAECADELLTVCLSPISMTWPSTPNGFKSAESQAINTFTPAKGWFSTSIHNRVWFEDINGDGLPDILGASDAGLYWQLNTGTGFGPELTQSNNIFTLANGWFSTSIHNRVWLADINGDGLPDILGASDYGLFWQLNTGTGFGPAQSQANSIFTPANGWFSTSIHNRVWIADINGDGLPDILGASDAGLYWQLNTGTGFGPAQSQANNIFMPVNGWFSKSIHNRVWLSDINGDGLPDILGATDSGLYWQLNTGTGFGPVQTQANNIFKPVNGWFMTSIHNRVWLSDINGDGLPDILGATDSGLYWQLNTGTGFGPVQTQANNIFKPVNGWFSTSIQNRVWLADINGDGLPDILGAADSGLYWQLNTGTGFGPVQTQANNIFKPVNGWFSTSIQNRVWLADINGDGLSDILGAADSGLHWQLNNGNAPNAKSNSISSIQNLDGTANISYQPLTNKNIYAKDAASIAPIIDLQMPMYVVSSVSRSNGVGGTLTANYTYGGLKAEQGGRGMLGFRWTQAVQAETGQTSRTEYRQDWPYTGLPSITKNTLAGGGNAGLLSQTVNTYGCLDFISASGCTVTPGRRYFPYLSQSTAASWDLNGAALPIVTSTSVYDAWGNPTRIVVSSDDGYAKTTTNTYANDTANWFLGRLLRATVTSATP